MFLAHLVSGLKFSALILLRKFCTNDNLIFKRLIWHVCLDLTFIKIYENLLDLVFFHIFFFFDMFFACVVSLVTRSSTSSVFVKCLWTK